MHKSRSRLPTRWCGRPPYNGGRPDEHPSWRPPMSVPVLVSHFPAVTASRPRSGHGGRRARSAPSPSPPARWTPTATCSGSTTATSPQARSSTARPALRRSVHRCGPSAARSSAWTLPTPNPMGSSRGLAPTSTGSSAGSNPTRPVRLVLPRLARPRPPLVERRNRGVRRRLHPRRPALRGRGTAPAALSRPPVHHSRQWLPAVHLPAAVRFRRTPRRAARTGPGDPRGRTGLPLHDTAGHLYPHLDMLRTHLHDRGVDTELRATACSYSPHPDSNRMLVCRRTP